VVDVVPEDGEMVRVLVVGRPLTTCESDAPEAAKLPVGL
jgi:hypothetical protein